MGLAASQADPCSTRQPTNELTWPWLCGTVGGAQPTAPGCRRGPLFPSLALGSCHGHHKGGSAVPMRICQGKQGKVCPRTGTRRNRGGKPLRAKLESLRGSPDPSSPPLGGRGTADRLPPHLLSSQLSWVAASEPPVLPTSREDKGSGSEATFF